MYIPPHFREEEISELHALMRTSPFATLITTQENRPFATHLPILLDAEGETYGTLRGHVARANPHWQDFDGEREALAIFQGPHAYISPAWYAVAPSVPTWNYAVVHAYGTPRVVDDAGLYGILRDSMALFDPTERLEALPEDYVIKMMRAIVGFEMEITRLEGKVKMSQNRTQDDQERVIAALRQTSSPLDGDVADWMQKPLLENSAALAKSGVGNRKEE
jgi:transcriptional regulator